MTDQIIGYGEDALTIWALRTTLNDIIRDPVEIRAARGRLSLAVRLGLWFGCTCKASSIMTTPN